jgi:hypothetical protein
MLPGFTKIVEERIRKAQQEGAFENLSGAGKPLEYDDYFSVPQELRMAYKILKNADCLPPEIELKKEIVKTEDLLTGIEDTAEKYKVLTKLNYLIMKLNLHRNTHISLEMPQAYLNGIVSRLEKKQGNPSPLLTTG